MAAIIETAPTVVEETSRSFGMFHVFMLIIILVMVYIGYIALQRKERSMSAKDKFLEAYEMVRQLCLQNADDRYFKSWWFPSKNSPVYRVFEFLETDKIRLEPLVGLDCRYMGHYLDFGGNYNFSFFVGRKWLVPQVEVVTVPHNLVHMQDNMVIVNCVSIDRKTMSTPYYPVVKMSDGKVCDAGFTLMEEFYDEKLSSDVIQRQGNLFVDSLEKVTKFNANVAYKRKTRGTDGGL